LIPVSKKWLAMAVVAVVAAGEEEDVAVAEAAVEVSTQYTTSFTPNPD
jgi:hypothetical protein